MSTRTTHVNVSYVLRVSIRTTQVNEVYVYVLMMTHGKKNGNIEYLSMRGF